jgi:hypothetical protein
VYEPRQCATPPPSVVARSSYANAMPGRAAGSCDQ